MKRIFLLPAFAFISSSAWSQQDTSQLDPVEVRATRASKTAPFTKTNLSKKEIEKINLGQDLPFLLNQTPSVIINSDAGNGVGYTGMRIRGSDGTRINVTMNGIPYNDPESHGSFFVNLPDLASSMNSIQIQRGVGTSSNGAGAFGASVNISTNEIRKDAYGEFNNSYGSFNTWKNTVKVGSGLINDHFTVDARFSRITSDGFIDRASSNLRSLYLSTAYLTEKSSLRFNLIKGAEKTYQAWNGILREDLYKSRTANSAGTAKPGEPYDNETDNYNQDHYQLYFNHQFNDRLSLNTALFLTRGIGYYEQYRTGEWFSDFGLPNFTQGGNTLENTDLVRQLFLDNYYYGNVFSLLYKHKNTQLTVGGAYTRYDGKHYGKVPWAAYGVPKDYKYYDLDALKTDLNVYTKWQQQLTDRLQSFVDIQYRTVRHDINGFRKNPSVHRDNTYKFFNPKAGLSYQHNNWNGYGSFSIGNKEPNRDDFEAGLTEQPKHETLYDVELGIEKKERSYFYGATFYYMNYKNQLVLTGALNDVGAQTRTNIPKSYRLGVELQGSVSLAKWISVSGNLALSENKIKRIDQFFTEYDINFEEIGQVKNNYEKPDISFSPSIIGGATVSILPLKNAEITLPAKYVGRQYLDNTGDKNRRLNDYFVQDMLVTYTVKNKFAKETVFVFQINNLFDKKYEPNGATYPYIYNGMMQHEVYLFPMAGINFMGGINIKL